MTGVNAVSSESRGKCVRMGKRIETTPKVREQGALETSECLGALAALAVDPGSYAGDPGSYSTWRFTAL